MLTEIEKLARSLAKADNTFKHYAWETLPEPVKVVYMDIAEDRLKKESLQLAEQDNEAAKTWGGDIDLVSFEGE